MHRRKQQRLFFCVDERVFRAHKSVLSLRCTKLYEIAKECEDDEQITIHSTETKVFKHVLDYAYTVRDPRHVCESLVSCKKVLIAADRYDCIDLKLFVESMIVEHFLGPQNAAELLLFADSHS